MHICQILVLFWSRYPALLYGISLLLGFYAFFYASWLIIIPLLGLWLPFLIYAYFRQTLLWKPVVLSLSLFGTCWLYAAMTYTFPILPEEGVEGAAYISIQNIQLQRSFFGTQWIYHCQLNHFYPHQANSQSIAHSIKCRIALPNQTRIHRPLAHQDYLVKGKLIKTDKGTFVLKVSTLDPWKIVPHSWSFAEMRYQWKMQLQKWIATHFSNPFSALFLSGLATGEFDDQWLRGQFARFGLQHIMAISGFHFAIVMGILALILRCFLSRHTCHWLLLGLMASYAFFLGPNPSIMRAWIMCTLVIIGSLIEKGATALNSLGVAILFVLLYDPLFCQTIGFQFSFLVTAAILLFYQTIDHYLRYLFVKRTLSKVIEMNVYDQHGHCILAFFRQGLALTIAVNLVALPLTLFYFQQFPLLSLFYNLFFPFLVSISLCLLIVGFIVSWVPLIGTLLQGFNNAYTHVILKFAYGLPETIDYYWRVDEVSSLLIVMYLTLIFFLGVIYREKIGVAQEEQFSFI